MTLLEAVTFSMPVTSEIRLDLSFTCLLAFSFFQNVVANDLPKSADNQPLLLIYIAGMMTYIFIAICLQCLTLYMANCSNRCRELPKCLQLLYKPTILKFEKEITHRNDSLYKSRRKALRFVWLDFARKCDRIFGLFFLFLVFITPCIVFLLIPNKTINIF